MGMVLSLTPFLLGAPFFLTRFSLWRWPYPRITSTLIATLHFCLASNISISLFHDVQGTTYKLSEVWTSFYFDD